MEYFITLRNDDTGEFSNTMGDVQYLEVPDAKPISPAHAKGKKEWVKKVMAAVPKNASGRRHILLHVHGFNIEQREMRARHKAIVQRFQRQKANGSDFDCLVISIDWPSDGEFGGKYYWSDREDALRTAKVLFKNFFVPFLECMCANSKIDVHILAHSMGCYVVREAFTHAEASGALANKDWAVKQVALIAADISSRSMKKGKKSSRSMYDRCKRLTNYYSAADNVLSASEGLRFFSFKSARLGRVGLPRKRRDDPNSPILAPDHTENVYCSKYYVKNKASFTDNLNVSHAWYYESDRFFEDLAHTLEGKLEAEEFPTRTSTHLNNLALIP